MQVTLQLIPLLCCVGTIDIDVGLNSHTGKRKTQNLCVMQDVVYSFPVTCKEGKWSIVQGLQIDDFAAQKLKATGDELVEEKALALECLSES